jgi:secreted trypsin-like serine protease
VGIYGLNLLNEICGGAIISSSWIITAAQCIKRSDGQELTIVAGATTRARDYRTIQAEARARNGDVRFVGGMKELVGKHAQIMANYNGCVGARIMHPKFVDPSKGNDIAVVEITCLFTFDKYVKPIALPESVLDSSTDLLVSGWGVREERLPSWAFFSVINEISVTKAKCEEKEFAEDKIFCATGKKSSEDVETCKRPLGNVECYGDAGGPAVASVSGEMRLRLAGITSFEKSYSNFYASQQCEDPASEVKYVNVWNYVQWINKTTNNLHERPRCYTDSGERCIFPFTANSVTYNGCELGWCRTTDSWDYCRDKTCGGSSMQVVEHRRQ